MEQACRIRVKARHDALVAQIQFVKQLQQKLEEGQVYSCEVTEARLRLKTILKGFEMETLRVAEFYKEDDAAIQEEYIKLQMEAEGVLAELDTLEKSIAMAPTTCIQGSALEVLRGLNITNENYDIALEMLKKRFGNKDLIVDAHYKAIHDLETAKEHSLRVTLDSIKKHMRILQSYGEDITGNFFRSSVCNKFPESIRYELNLLLPEEKTIDAILETLERIISSQERAKENLNVSPNNGSTTEVLQVKTVNKSTLKRKFNGNKDKPHEAKKRRKQCTFCNGDHFEDQCKEYSAISQRKKRLTVKRLCFLCFRPGHYAAKCNKRTICYHCKGHHHRALCFKLKGKNDKRELVTEKENPSQDKGKSIIDDPENIKSNVFSINDVSHLQMAIIKIKNKRTQQYHTCRLFLDSGSQRSYITAKLAKELDLVPDSEDLLQIFTFGSDSPTETNSPSVEVSLLTRRNIQRDVRANVVPFITGRLSTPKIQTSNTIDIVADDGSMGEAVDMLIGMNYFYSFIRNIVKTTMNQQEIYYVDTDFGWTVTNSIQTNEEENTLSIITYCQCHESSCPYFTEPDLPLRDIDMKFLWTLESIGIIDSPKVTQQEEAVQHFNNTVKYEGGRYYVKWPWTHYPPSLPTNYGLDLGRLKSLIRRLDKRMLEEYEDILKSQLEAGIIEIFEPQAPLSQQTTPPFYYTPHHIIKQEGKRGRIVYDATAKSKDQLSLNENM
ncbi:putative peptidase (DUF1758) domain-containing protein [Phthorimaea operculella]|nr:putative peptidase (DUF1758) domain-containing protein [Phthorimaea operculella]